MPQQIEDLNVALRAYDTSRDKEGLEQGEAVRREILKRFPLDAWHNLPLERYALGQEGSEETFSLWLEFRSQELGSIRGGNAQKHVIYKRKDRPGWFFYGSFKDVHEAWAALRAGFVKAFELAKMGDWDAIDSIEALEHAPMVRLKTLHVYFPTDIIPIFAVEHIRHFLRLLGCPEADERTWGVVHLNRALLSAVRERSEFKGWSTNAIQKFLYHWANPRQAPRVVKIAPGHDAEFWDECLRGGYICVGWDDVGDLRAFATQDDFRARFVEAYGPTYRGHQPTLSKKAKEVWTLRELEPGDVVIANKGTSKVLGVGEVVEPGYEWISDRPKYKHTVRVKWDTSYARDVPPQARWAVVTVDKVPANLYETILRKSPKADSIDPLFEEIAIALERKGQVILYGPPGTGKTYVARRFAVYWLLKRQGKTVPAGVLTDPARFEEAERELSTMRVVRRVWWVVANPKEWSWDRLFKERRVSYRFGRLQRNYPLVQPGDLVIGYQSTPDKRIVALARVERGFTTVPGEKEPTIELAPLAPVERGLSYEELQKDPILSASEPMRFRNQGTLFALSADEAEHVLAQLAEREPSVQSLTEGETGVGPLTRLTFHPSYSYEDFIEGFRPADTGGSSLVLRLEDGVFKRICREGQSHTGKTFLVLVDEINRANVAKVFGELITLLERDKRGVVVTLPQSKESFAIPPNIYVLGTMNTADRSIKLLDAALRRRFAFIEMLPDTELLRGSKVRGLALDEFLEELNRRVASVEGREKQIGHSYLMDGAAPITDSEEFVRRFRQEILPLLQEYCYDDYGELAKYLGERLVDQEAQTLNEALLADTDGLLDVLEEEFGTKGTTGE